MATKKVTEMAREMVALKLGAEAVARMVPAVATVEAVAITAIAAWP